MTRLATIEADLERTGAISMAFLAAFDAYRILKVEGRDLQLPCAHNHLL